MEFVKPVLGYAELWPMLVVFGVACAGVVVEAFVAREHRYVTQVALSAPRARGRPRAARSTWRWTSTALRNADSDDVLARGTVTAGDTLVIDGPTAVLWVLVLVFAIGGVLLFAERRLEGGVSAFAGQAAALPGTDAEREASTRGLDHTEVYPLAMFAVGGMLLFPAANDLLTMFVALEVLSLPLYLLCGLARRRRLLSQEAALKYFLLGAFSSGFFLYGVALIYGFAGTMTLTGHQRGGPQRHVQPGAAAHRHGDARRRAAVQGRCRAVPGLDARRLPGRAHRGHRVHGGLHQGGRVRRPAAALLRRVRSGPLELAADDVDRRDPHHARRRDRGLRADRREADARLLLHRAHRVPAHRDARRPGGHLARRRRDHLAPGRALLPGDATAPRRSVPSRS